MTCRQLKRRVSSQHLYGLHSLQEEGFVTDKLKGFFLDLWIVYFLSLKELPPGWNVSVVISWHTPLP